MLLDSISFVNASINIPSRAAALLAKFKSVTCNFTPSYINLINLLDSIYPAERKGTRINTARADFYG